MSRLDEFIKEKCPNGVQFYTLAELEDNQRIKLGRGNVISKDEIKNNPGDYPVYSSSALNNGIIGFYNKYMFDDERITWSIDGGGKFFYRPASKYSVTNVCGWLTVFDCGINTKYLYYVLSSEWEKKVFDYVHKAHPSVIRKEYRIPIPPLEVQNEIVQYLDNFAELTAELTAELSNRKKQYEYYRDSLLLSNPDIPRINLRSVVKKSCSGATPKKDIKEYYDGGDIPWLRTQDVKFNEISEVNSYITDVAVKETAAKWIPTNCVIVAISGASAGRCAINKIPTTTNQHCLNLEIDETKALYKYVYYCVFSQYDELISRKQGARGDLNSSLILGIEIPLPSLEEQGRIVKMLDRFNDLCSNISDGLPAEIEARKKQYVYYRDKLLTFEEAK